MLGQIKPQMRASLETVYTDFIFFMNYNKSEKICVYPLNPFYPRSKINFKKSFSKK